MKRIRSGDAEISYEALGKGAPVIVLHPFPVNHDLWLPAIQPLISHYQVILPDLRGHGDSEIGDGPARMEKHAADIARIMDDLDIGRAPLVGNSIGGYIIFEFWRRYRGRIAGIALCNTKAQADTPETRGTRLKAAEDVIENGTEVFFQNLVLKLMGKTTVANRPDLVQGALAMMRKMSANNVAMVQRGMAVRPDSVDILKTINVPALVITGDEDILTGPPEAALMHTHMQQSQLRIIPKAGHYSPWEQHEEVGKLLRQFLDGFS